MASSEMALVRTDVSEELNTSETSVLTRTTRPNISEDAILQVMISWETEFGN
jgi:hypothetical protein